jgi:hypothetical protein
MRKLHHLMAAIAAVLGLVSLSGVWWTITLPSGASVALTGLEASALASTALGAVAASYGAALLVRGVVRRVLGLVQAGLAGLAGYAWMMVSAAPALGALSEITALTGIAGDAALEGLMVTPAPSFVVMGFLAVAAALVSGLIQVVALDAPTTPSRYDRHASDASGSDPVSTWDSLSEGQDPTKR